MIIRYRGWRYRGWRYRGWRYRGWQGIAAVVITFSSTPVWAQLPSTTISPLNHLGRSWGFGVSDGYHECPEAKTKLTTVLPRSNTQTMTVSHPQPCVDSEKKTSFFSKMNPFRDSGAGTAPSCGTASCGTGTSGRMTVLPPSPNMYQQFAAPSETPLPGSDTPSNSVHSYSNQTMPGNSNSNLQDAVPPSVGNQVPDPLDLNSLESPSLRIESTQPSPEDTVPPPPVLRKRQQGDKPLGEEAESKSPREQVSPEPADAKPPRKADDSLDLLPKDEPPPITIQSRTKPGRSLISHVMNKPDNVPDRPSPNAQEAMLRQYYGQAYSRREQPSAEVRSGTSNPNQPTLPMLNRYR